MSDGGSFITSAPLNKGAWAFTLPKTVREELEVDLIRFRILSFNLEKDEQISIGFGGEKVIGSSEFLSSNVITIPVLVRKFLKLEKGKSKLGFYKDNNIIIIRKMP